MVTGFEDYRFLLLPVKQSNFYMVMLFYNCGILKGHSGLEGFTVSKMLAVNHWTII